MKRGCGLCLFNVEKRGQEPIVVFDSPKGGFREDGAGLFCREAPQMDKKQQGQAAVREVLSQ